MGCCGRRELPAVLLWASRAAGGAAMGVTSYRRCCCGRREPPTVLLWPCGRRELQQGCCGGHDCCRGCCGRRGCRGTYCLVGVAADDGPRRKGWRLLVLILLI